MVDMLRYAAGMMERISKSNALYPLLIGLLVTALLAGSTVLCTDSIWIRAISFIPVILFSWKAISSYDFFMRNNPEMLRTETHVRQMRALELFGDRDNPLRADARDVVSIVSDPALPPASGPASSANLEQGHD